VSVISDKTLVEAAVAKYHSDEEFRDFVNGIRTSLLSRYNSFMSVEDFMSYEVQPGLSTAAVIYRRWSEAAAT